VTAFGKREERNINDCTGQPFTFHAFHPKAVNEEIKSPAGLLAYRLLLVLPVQRYTVDEMEQQLPLQARIHSYGDSVGLTPTSLFIQLSLKPEPGQK
jgi:hypothetical protein